MSLFASEKRPPEDEIVADGVDVAKEKALAPQGRSGNHPNRDDRLPL